MADTVNTVWIYPPNFDGTVPAAGLNLPGWATATVLLTGLSDGTGETNVTKVDISTLRAPNGQAPTKVDVEKIEYSVSGLNVLLQWDRTVNKDICRLPGVSGANSGTILGPIYDSGSGSTGDIILSTTSQTLGDSYSIMLYLRLK